MTQCILCVGDTRESKLVYLTEPLNDKLTFEEAIRQQITYADTFLSSPTLKHATCRGCFRVFKAFYQLLDKIHHSQSFCLQTMVKIEDDLEGIVVSALSTDEPLMENKQQQFELEEIKLENEFDKEPKETDLIAENDDDFEWEMDETAIWKDDEDENEKPEVEMIEEILEEEVNEDANPKEVEEVTEQPKAKRKRRVMSERFEDTDTDYDPEKEKPAKKIEARYVRYLKRWEVTPEMIAAGQKSVTIDGLEYRIPRKHFKKESTQKCLTERVKNSIKGDERLQKFMDIKCELCGADFTSFFKLGQHFRRLHPGTEPFLRCCGRKFYRRLVLLDHLDCHDDSVVHECKECNKTYKTDKILKVHMDRIHLKKYQESVCNICGKTLRGSGALKKHLVIHEEDTREFECYICKKSKYKNFKLLQTHFNVNHNPDKPARSVCHICSAVVRSSHLKRHMEMQHSNKTIEKEQCEICEHWIMKCRMHIHKRKHSMGGVTCKLCGKYLSSYGSLYSHNKIVHSNIRDFKCDYCGKGFHKVKKLREHVAARHTREFLFKCRVEGCGREFRAEGNWKMHERKAHPEEYEKSFAPFYKRAPKEQIESLEVETEDGTALETFEYFSYDVKN